MVKVANWIGCQDGCQACLDCCLQYETSKHTKIKKNEIEHIIRQPETYRLRHDSDISNAESTSSPTLGRDRKDSENNSRKGSTSSNQESRKTSVTPVIDMKPIEFWAANRETVQPRTPKRRLATESDFNVENFQRDLYEVEESHEECLTDEQKLARFNLGQIHFGLQYEIPSKSLIVKLIEAKDLPPPFCKDSSKQDMAHSNPYAKISLLPDQKNSRQSSVQRKTQCPEWNEIFVFEIPYIEAQRRTLEIYVKDFDKYSRHCVIGQIHLPLNNVNMVKGGHMWKPLLPKYKGKYYTLPHHDVLAMINGICCFAGFTKNLSAR